MILDSKPTGRSTSLAGKGRRGWVKPALLVALVGAVMALLLWFALAGDGGENDGPSAEVKAVQQNDLLITVTARGELKAAKSVWVISEIEAQAQILKIIEEGTRVKKGDWLCTLDTTNLENQLDKQSLSEERARSSKEQAEASLNITLKQNESELSQAKLDLEFARIDLKKFDDPDDGDRAVQIQDQEKNIKLATSELTNAKEVYEWSEKLFKKEYITKNELDRDRISLQRATLNLKLAEARKKNLIEFDLPKQKRRLEADVNESLLNLERVKERCKQKAIQARTDLSSKKRQWELEVDQLDRIKKQIESGRITAPGDGLVVYANESSRWRRGRQDPIAEGVSVRYHQKIISLPDVSNIIVEVSIHESARSQVWAGQQALITVEALEGKTFKGTLVKVPEVPDSSSGWLTPDRKVYKVRIRVENVTDDIRPGMSAKVTVFCEKVENAIQIPIQAVNIVGKDTHYVYVKNGGNHEARVVEVGKHNDKNVQILKGLKPGELVYLSEPVDAVRPEAKSQDSPDQVPTGIEVSTDGAPKRTPPTNRRSNPSGRRGERSPGGREGEGGSNRRRMDPKRMLQMIKGRYPDLYEQVKDLPAAEQIRRIREHFSKMRDSGSGRRPGSSGDRRSGGSRRRPSGDGERGGSQRRDGGADE